MAGVFWVGVSIVNAAAWDGIICAGAASAGYSVDTGRLIAFTLLMIAASFWTAATCLEPGLLNPPEGGRERQWTDAPRESPEGYWNYGPNGRRTKAASQSLRHLLRTSDQEWPIERGPRAGQ
jgi:hypothetical protein